MSRTSPTLRLPKNDATLGPPDEQPQPEACKRKMADPTKHPLSFLEYGQTGLAWQGPTPLCGFLEPKPSWGPLLDNLNQRLTFRKAGGPVGSGFESTSRLGGSHTPSRNGLFTLLKSGVAYRGCSTRMAEGEPRRVIGGFGLTVPRTGLRGAPKLVAGLVPPQCLAQLAHAGGRGPKTNPPPKKKLGFTFGLPEVDLG